MPLSTIGHLIFLGVDDLNAARTFYEEVLGFAFMADENGTLVFDVGVPLRIARVEGFTPQTFTVLGWVVDDIEAETKKLTAAGVTMVRYPNMPHDEQGIVKFGDVRLLWFKDPAGNLLSLTQA